MPIYEYQCAACGQVTEKWQKISEPPVTVCPACGGSLSKLISSCAFHLKGSGWYVTDYGGGRPGVAAPDKSDEPKAAASCSEGKQPQVSEKTDSSPPPKFK